MKKFILMAFVAIAMMSCSSSSTDHMSESISYCEQHLDSIAAHSSFMDTVGETDEYMFLVESKEEFDKATTEHDRKSAYKWYNYWYNQCIKMHTDLEVRYCERY